MQKNKILIKKSELEMIIEAQASIVPNYNVKTYEGQCAYAVEQQSADFLEDYIEGKLILSDDTIALLPQYFAILKQSQYRRIKSNVTQAENIYKRSVIEKNKEQEKIKYWKDTQFNILSKKKEVQKLSSADLLLIGKLINEEKGYSTTKNKDRLRSIISLRITDTLSGKIPADENFAELVDKYGTLEQKKRASKSSQKEKAEIVTPIVKKIDTPKPIKVINEDKQPKSKEKKVELVAVGKDKNILIPKNSVVIDDKQDNHQNQKKVATPNDKKGKPSNKKQESNKQGWWKKVWQKVKRPVLILGVAALAVLGVRGAYNSLSSSNRDNNNNNKDFDQTENVITPINEAPAPVTDIKDTQNQLSDKEKAYEAAKKNRFDTALSLHLGVAERDNLYQKLETLEKAGKIKYENGTTREWYAYALTILDKVQPNSKENSVAKLFLNGGDVDAKYINDLVIKINPRGTGIKGVGKHSAYDNASDDMKKKHREALNTFNLLDAEMDM